MSLWIATVGHGAPRIHEHHAIVCRPACGRLTDGSNLSGSEGYALASFDLKSYARRGAQARLRELADEAKQLLTVFPDLSDSFDEDELPMNFILKRGARKAGVRRRRRKMTAAQRKAVGVRMKKYWAARRKAKK